MLEDRETWPAVLIVRAGCDALKLAGMSLPERVLPDRSVSALVVIVAAAGATALVRAIS